MKDYYGILGVPSNATLLQIRDAYRRLAFEWHPDRNPHRHDVAHERFLDLGEAYSVLKDPRHRMEHDLARPKAERSRTRDTRSGPATGGTPFAETPSRAAPSGAAYEFDETTGPPTPTPADGLRQYRARVRKLAQELAAAERQGRTIDITLATATLVVAVTALLLTAFRLIGMDVPEVKPTLWSVVIAWMAALVLAAWFFSLRERRVEQYVPFAEEVLERTGKGWSGAAAHDGAHA